LDSSARWVRWRATFKGSNEWNLLLGLLELSSATGDPSKRPDKNIWECRIYILVESISSWRFTIGVLHGGNPCWLV
jgi:hypothetical protein